MTTHINLIAAVGENGEIGNKGRIPWRGDRLIAAAVAADLAWFGRLTHGGVLVVGSATWREMIGLGFVEGTRTVWEYDGRVSVMETLTKIAYQHPHRDVWICGGARTYEAFMPFVQRFYISRLPWTGEADRFMPPILSNWVCQDTPAHGNQDT